ncbi:MAG: TetR/AcrR family transcriptional regulator [Candidatus Dormibacteraeota bacterium]|nr:TetR/AcrR family transcriptional regulator [Candidatus Dormibacteraeota bacterium]
MTSRVAPRRTPAAAPARSDRAPRADAQRNRAAILAAAEREFRTHGLDASMDGIAQRAAVGVGTLYRNYPTKEALVRDILAAKLEPLVSMARRLKEAGDPAAAFFTFLRRIGEESTSFKALADRLAASGLDVKSLHQDVGSELMAAVAQLLRGAQSAGAVRADVTPDDVMVLMASMGHVGAIAQNRAARTRCVTLLCDALRSERADAVPGAPSVRRRART